MRNGYKGGVYYISASVLGSYIYDKVSGIKQWLGIREKQSYEAKQGVAWHKKLGYDNRDMFYREMVLDDNTVVILFGIPDSCNGVVEELKTVKGFKISNKKLESARVQLLVYLYIMDKEEGRVVFVSRDNGAIIYVDDVKRDDEKLKKIVKKFICDVCIFQREPCLMHCSKE